MVVRPNSSSAAAGSGLDDRHDHRGDYHYPPHYGHGRSPGWYGDGHIVRCVSRDFRDGFCRVKIRHGAQIVRQISRNPCRYGRTWGYDSRGIWVTNGCVAEFRVG